MATINEYNKLTLRERVNRYFSEAFKRKKVGEIERNITTVAEICREYQVSGTAVYRWIYKYSRMRKQGVKQVVEARSDTRKILQLSEDRKELERLIGEKQIKIDFLEKMIELAEEEYHVDIKKKFSSKRFIGTGIIGKNIITK